MSDTANPNPDWYPDPTGRFELRYWDGSQWTEHVSSAGQQRSDSLPGGPPDAAAAAGLSTLGATAPRAEPVPAATPQPVAAPEPEPEPAVAAQPAPDWYPDPTGRYEQRYWDGSQWTEHVTASGQQGVDPLPDEEDDLAAAAAAAVDAAAASAGAPPDEPVISNAPSDPEPAAQSNPSGDYTLNGAGQLVNREAQSPATSGPAPDWYPDPSGRQELRYWDGAQWTEHASTAGRQLVDPLS